MPLKALCLGIPLTFLLLNTLGLLGTQSANHGSNPTRKYAHEETEVQRGEVINWRWGGERFLQHHVIGLAEPGLKA